MELQFIMEEQDYLAGFTDYIKYTKRLRHFSGIYFVLSVLFLFFFILQDSFLCVLLAVLAVLCIFQGVGYFIPGRATIYRIYRNNKRLERIPTGFFGQHIVTFQENSLRVQYGGQFQEVAYQELPEPYAASDCILLFLNGTKEFEIIPNKVFTDEKKRQEFLQLLMQRRTEPMVKTDEPIPVPEDTQFLIRIEWEEQSLIEVLVHGNQLIQRVSFWTRKRVGRTVLGVISAVIAASSGLVFSADTAILLVFIYTVIAVLCLSPLLVFSKRYTRAYYQRMLSKDRHMLDGLQVLALTERGIYTARICANAFYPWAAVQSYIADDSLLFVRTKQNKLFIIPRKAIIVQGTCQDAEAYLRQKIEENR